MELFHGLIKNIIILDSIPNTASEKRIRATLSVSPSLREKQPRKHQVQHSTQQ